MSPMKLTAFNYGTTELAENQIFPGGDPQTMRPIALLFFLIETEERRILVDTGSVIVHIFIQEEREYYDLERLWGDADEMDISEILKPE